MTEAEWQACAESFTALESFGAGASDRKLRLAACAFARLVWHRIRYDWSRRALEAMEALLHAEFDADPDGIGGLYRRLWTQEEAARAWAAQQDGPRWLNGRPPKRDVTPLHAVHWATLALDPREPENEKIDPRRRPLLSARQAAANAARALSEAGEPPAPALAAVVRDLFGAPTRPQGGDVSWQVSAARSLAYGAYEERQLPSGTLDPQRLAVLADALEEAGCADPDLLGHLRSPGPHVRGCWALDLVLSKE